MIFLISKIAKINNFNNNKLPIKSIKDLMHSSALKEVITAYLISKRESGGQEGA